MTSSSRRSRRIRASVRGLRPTCFAELSVEVTVAHPEFRRDVTDRAGRFRRQLPHGRLAPGERVAVERLWRPHRRLDEIEGLGRRTAARQLAPEAGGPGPCLRQVDNPAAQGRRRDPECGPAPNRSGDDPDAVRLALGLVDDRPVVRADKETRVGEKSGALTDRGLQDRVAEDEGCDGRPSGSDTLADPGDSATSEPDLFDKAARLTPTWRGTYSNTRST